MPTVSILDGFEVTDADREAAELRFKDNEALALRQRIGSLQSDAHALGERAAAAEEELGRRREQARDWTDELHQLREQLSAAGRQLAARDAEVRLGSAGWHRPQPPAAGRRPSPGHARGFV